MSEDLLALLWRLAVVATVAFVVSFVWAFVATALSQWDKPFRGDEKFASIRPWPPLWWLMTAFLGVVVVGGVASGFYSGSPVILLLMLVIGAGLGLLVWMSFLMCLPISWITWNEHGVEGPISSFSLSRRELAWSAITKITQGGGGNVFENAQGQRIVWTDFHIGSRFLWGFLVHKRPDLKEQLDRTIRSNG
jgi:hypothetical protein